MRWLTMRVAKSMRVANTMTVANCGMLAVYEGG